MYNFYKGVRTGREFAGWEFVGSGSELTDLKKLVSYYMFKHHTYLVLENGSYTKCYIVDGKVQNLA